MAKRATKTKKAKRTKRPKPPLSHTEIYSKLKNLCGLPAEAAEELADLIDWAAKFRQSCYPPANWRSKFESIIGTAKRLADYLQYVRADHYLSQQISWELASLRKGFRFVYRLNEDLEALQAASIECLKSKGKGGNPKVDQESSLLVWQIARVLIKHNIEPKKSGNQFKGIVSLALTQSHQKDKKARASINAAWESIKEMIWYWKKGRLDEYDRDPEDLA